MYYIIFIIGHDLCKRKVELSHLSKVKMSPSLDRRLGALEGGHGMGHDERARAWQDRGSVTYCRGKRERHNGGVRVGGQHAAYPADGQTSPAASGRHCRNVSSSCGRSEMSVCSCSPTNAMESHRKSHTICAFMDAPVGASVF